MCLLAMHLAAVCVREGGKGIVCPGSVACDCVLVGLPALQGDLEEKSELRGALIQSEEQRLSLANTLISTQVGAVHHTGQHVAVAEQHTGQPTRTVDRTFWPGHRQHKGVGHKELGSRLVD